MPRTRRVPARTDAAIALLTLALAVAAFALLGCDPKVPQTTPGITGTITSMLPGEGRPANFLVQGGAQPPGAVSDKALVTITADTKFFDRYGKPMLQRRVARLALRAKVRVWFDGAVAESYPVQGTALAVQVIGEE